MSQKCYKCKDIYDSALRLLSENGDDGVSVNTDYFERAPYLAAVFCAEMSETDKAYRIATGLAPASDGYSETYLPLADDFPLSARFMPAAAEYMAAMLVFGENTELSEKLFGMYMNSLSAIVRTLPASISAISNRYCF